MADTMNPNGSAMPAPAGDWQAAIAYFSFLFLYTAWAKSDSPSHMWHAKNGAGLFVIYLGLYIVMNILVTVLPVGMVGLLAMIMNLINLAIGLASLWAAWNAWKGKQWTIPFVTNIGQKIPLEKWFHKGAAAPMSAPAAAPSAPAAPAAEPTAPAPAPMAEPVAPVAPAPTPEPAASAPMAPEAPAAPSEPTPPTPPATPAA